MITARDAGASVYNRAPMTDPERVRVSAEAAQ
jgi:hypothetical protein